MNQHSGSGIRVNDGLLIGEDELRWRFSRSSGPGGQGVNTTDSRVQLSWSLAESKAVSDPVRARIASRLADRLRDGVITVTAAERRSQWQNRAVARRRLAELLAAAAAPPRRPRRRRRPSRAAADRRIRAKKHRGEVKSGRRAPGPDG